MYIHCMHMYLAYIVNTFILSQFLQFLMQINSTYIHIFITGSPQYATRNGPEARESQD